MYFTPVSAIESDWLAALFYSPSGHGFLVRVEYDISTLQHRDGYSDYIRHPNIPARVLAAVKGVVYKRPVHKATIIPAPLPC